MTTVQAAPPRCTVALLGVLAFQPTLAWGQIQLGRIYEGGEVISEPAAGLALTLPTGWRGALMQDGSTFMLEPVEGIGLMVVAAQEFDEATARAELSADVDLGDGVILRPTGAIEVISSGHLSRPMTVQGLPSAMVGTVDVRLTPGGVGVAFIVLSPEADAASHLSDMRAFALSLRVTEPTPVAETSSGDEWFPYMRGRYLARYYTTSGYTERTELWLCSDGSFLFSDEGGGFGGGASGAFQGSGGGRWSATGAGARGALILDWSNGQRSEWALEFNAQGDELYVNGSRWLRGDNERCR
jgi:hypothetical protein